MNNSNEIFETSISIHGSLEEPYTKSRAMVKAFFKNTANRKSIIDHLAQHTQQLVLTSVSPLKLETAHFYSELIPSLETLRTFRLCIQKNHAALKQSNKTGKIEESETYYENIQTAFDKITALLELEQEHIFATIDRLKNTVHEYFITPVKQKLATIPPEDAVQRDKLSHYSGVLFNFMGDKINNPKQIIVLKIGHIYRMTVSINNIRKVISVMKELEEAILGLMGNVRFITEYLEENSALSK